MVTQCRSRNAGHVFSIAFSTKTDQTTRAAVLPQVSSVERPHDQEFNTKPSSYFISDEKGGFDVFLVDPEPEPEPEPEPFPDHDCDRYVFLREGRRMEGMEGGKQGGRGEEEEGEMEEG